MLLLFTATDKTNWNVASANEPNLATLLARPDYNTADKTNWNIDHANEPNLALLLARPDYNSTDKSTIYSYPAALANRDIPSANDTNVFLVYAAGTPYSLTATPALLDFGTTDPNLQITRPGRYLLFCNVVFDYNQATFTTNEQITVKLRRVNNTPADIDNASRTRMLGIVTLCKTSMGSLALPPTYYSTGNSNDYIQIYGSISAIPSPGTVDANSASILAVRLP